MSRTQRHIQSQSNTINGESYAIIQKPTDAAFISEEIMEINEETKSLRQEGEIVHSQSAFAKDKKTKRQKKEESA